MKRRPALKYVLVALAICAFGAADALVKGQHGGARDAIANVSAPWLLISFLAAAVLAPRRLTVGALVGMLSTVVALASYSAVRSLRGFETGGQVRGLSTMLVSSLENRWFLLGLVGGAVLGVVSTRLAVDEQWMIIALVVGTVLVMEPAARIIWAIAKGEPARTLVPTPAVWTVEALSGCTAVFAVMLHRLRRERHPEAPTGGAS